MALKRNAQLKPGKPLDPISDRRLKAFGGHQPRSTLDKPGAARAAPKTKRPADTGPDKSTVEQVWRRDRGRCVPCGNKLYGRRGVEWSVSHRKLRSQGGDNRLSNLMLSCGNGTSGCEGMIHAHPQRARDAGWMVSRELDPAVIPVEHSRHGHVLLLDDGGWRRVKAEFIPAGEEPDEHPF
jgi:hypothetical protein